MSMRADTQTITLPVSFEEAFSFWRSRKTCPDGRSPLPAVFGVKAMTGSFRPLRERCRSASSRMLRGTIDFHMRAPGIEVIAYSRVVPNDSGTEYVFTQFQQPGMADDVFAGQRAAVAEELAILPMLFRAQSACPIGR